MRRPDLFEIWGTRYAWIASAALCILLLKEVWQTSIPLIAVSVMNADPRTLGLLVATETLPLPLLGLFIGNWVDRHGPARVLGWALAGLLAVLSAGMLLSFGSDLSHAIVALFPLVFAVGLHAMLFDVSLLAVTPTLVDAARLPWANKVQAIGQSLAEMGGPILAGAVIAFAGARGVMATLWLLCLVALALWWRSEKTTRQTGSARSAEPLPGQAPGGRWIGVRMLTGSALMRAIVFNSLAWNLFYGMLLPVFVSCIAAVDVRPELTVSLTFSANGAGFFCGGLASSWLVARLGTARTILAAKATGALAGGALLVLPDVQRDLVAPIAAAVFFVFGMVVAMSQISSVSLRQAAIARHYLGRVMAAFRVATWTGLPVGSVVGGYSAHLLGTDTALVLAIGFNLLSTGLLFRTPLLERDPLPASTRPEVPSGTP